MPKTFGRTCESCAMMMMDIADFAAKNRRSNYCRYCTNNEGMLQSPQERLERFTTFFIEDEQLSIDDARKKAIVEMRKMPAWKGKI